MTLDATDQKRIAKLEADLAYIIRNFEVPTPDSWSTLPGVPSALKTDPNADRIIFWDDSAGQLQHLQLGNWLSITGTTLAVAAAAASASAQGIVELATDAEAQTGTDTTRAVTPANLSARTATSTRTGIVELATDAEAIAGTDTVRAVTPANMAAVLSGRAPFAIAAGKVAVAAVAAGASADLTVTFPASRFTQSPIVLAFPETTRLNGQVTPTPTTSGCTIRVTNWTAAASAAVNVHWIAIQMLSGSAAG